MMSATNSDATPIQNPPVETWRETDPPPPVLTLGPVPGDGPEPVDPPGGATMLLGVPSLNTLSDLISQ